MVLLENGTTLIYSILSLCMHLRDQRIEIKRSAFKHKSYILSQAKMEPSKVCIFLLENIFCAVRIIQVNITAKDKKSYMVFLSHQKYNMKIFLIIRKRNILSYSSSESMFWRKKKCNYLIEFFPEGSAPYVHKESENIFLLFSQWFICLEA